MNKSTRSCLNIWPHILLCFAITTLSTKVFSEDNTQKTSTVSSHNSLQRRALLKILPAGERHDGATDTVGWQRHLIPMKTQEALVGHLPMPGIERTPSIIAVVGGNMYGKTWHASEIAKTLQLDENDPSPTWIHGKSTTIAQLEEVAKHASNAQFPLQTEDLKRPVFIVDDVDFISVSNDDKTPIKGDIMMGRLAVAIKNISNFHDVVVTARKRTDIENIKHPGDFLTHEAVGGMSDPVEIYPHEKEQFNELMAKKIGTGWQTSIDGNTIEALRKLPPGVIISLIDAAKKATPLANETIDSAYTSSVDKRKEWEKHVSRYKADATKNEKIVSAWLSESTATNTTLKTEFNDGFSFSDLSPEYLWNTWEAAVADFTKQKGERKEIPNLFDRDGFTAWLAAAVTAEKSNHNNSSISTISSPNTLPTVTIVSGNTAPKISHIKIEAVEELLDIKAQTTYLAPKIHFRYEGSVGGNPDITFDNADAYKTIIPEPNEQSAARQFEQSVPAMYPELLKQKVASYLKWVETQEQ